MAASDTRMCDYRVAPFTGAWIEMQHQLLRDIHSPVAPFTGAWIEIVLERHFDI